MDYQKISQERFSEWIKKFVAEKATPVLAIGVSHDAADLGRIVVTVVANDNLASVPIICAMLREAIAQLES